MGVHEYHQFSSQGFFFFFFLSKSCARIKLIREVFLKYKKDVFHTGTLSWIRSNHFSISHSSHYYGAATSATCCSTVLDPKAMFLSAETPDPQNSAIPELYHKLLPEQSLPLLCVKGSGLNFIIKGNKFTQCQ